MEALMVDRIQSSLRLFMHHNAIFLCERLCAEFPSELNLQLMATCYLQNNQAYYAYHALKEAKLPQPRYLFALSCLRMNLFREAEAALCPANDPNAEVPNGAAGLYLLGLIYRCTGRRTHAADHFNQALVMDSLLWAAYKELCKLGVAEEANECFNDSAALSIQHQHTPELSSQNFNSCYEDQHVHSGRTVLSGDSSPMQSKQLHINNIREKLAHPYGAPLAPGQTTNSGSSNSSQYNTPAFSQLSGIAPPPLFRNAQLYMNELGGDGSTRLTINPVNQIPKKKFVDEGKLRKAVRGVLFDSGSRRSTRLREATSNANSNALQVGGKGNHSSSKFMGGFSSSSSTKMGSAALLTVTAQSRHSWASENFDEGLFLVGAQKQLEVSSLTRTRLETLGEASAVPGRRPENFDDSRVDGTAVTSSPMANSAGGNYLEQPRLNPQIGGNPAIDSRVTNGIRELLGLLRILGEGYRLSCMYRCQEALDVYLKLLQHQYKTGWVLSQVGKAYFELVDYLEAVHFFDLARQVSPCTLEGMDIYSTVLFHLKEDMKLSYLAKELITIDRLSPQAWCAVGNCYSLQKDHETALKKFQRAVQLDSRFTYAHTLCGHEYFSLEEYENGIKCYQSALRVDERHYNSWYGLGIIYLRQEKFQFAEHHFQKAHDINPRSSVINCYLGMALHSLKKNEEALETMDKAIVADRENPLPMYQKALILQSLERHDEALKALQKLIEFTPNESSIYALMGKIYSRCNLHEKAMFYFGLALDLKPPAADVAIIKSAMEKLNLPDDLDDAP